MVATPVPLDADWLAAHLPDRPRDAHKGTFGRLLLVAGSLEYAGAALLSASGALRSGAGLVTLATPESVAGRVMGLIPELTMMPLSEEAAGLISPAGWRRVATESATYDAIVIGPGLGRQQGTLRRSRNLVAELRRPAVVDADGLNALATGEHWWRGLHDGLVLTPHPVEFGRLRGGEVPGDGDEERALAATEAAAEWGQVVVLKGARTVVAAPGGELLVCRVATPALATPGSGDVLAGCIGALLAQGLEPLAAAGCGVALHAAAGMIAEQEIGTAGVLAGDIARLLPRAARSARQIGR